MEIYIKKSHNKYILNKTKEEQEAINKVKIYNKSSESKQILNILEVVLLRLSI